MKKVIFGDFSEYNCKTSRLGNYHLCNCFVKDGYEALWVSNAYNQLIYFKDKEDYLFKKSLSSPQRHTLAKNIYGFAPYSWNLYGNYLFSRNASKVLKSERFIIPDVSKSLAEMDFLEADVLWLSNPKLFWLSNVVKYKKMVYRIADDYEKFKEYPDVSIIEKEIIRKADVVFITSSTLQDKVKKHGKKPILLGNGACLDDFFNDNVELPPEYKHNNKKKIIYVGAIKYWMDVELIEELSESVHADIFLIGQKEIDLSSIESKKNVHILGPRTYEELPGFLKHSDVGIIPFVKSSLTDSISPLKLFEYCSAGLATVSSNLEEVMNLKAPIYTASTKAEFIKRVNQYLLEGYDKSKLIEYGKLNSWDCKYQMIRDLLSKTHELYKYKEGIFMSLVSVIIPYYNSRNWVLDAINSVLNQIYKDFEIILIDDGSCDHGYEMVNDFIRKNNLTNIKNLRQQNAGLSKARNCGITNASGEYIAFLNSDDTWEKDKLKLQIEFMESHKEFAITGTNYSVITNTQYKKYKQESEYIEILFYRALFKVNFFMSSIIVRRDVLTSENIFFREGKNQGEDLLFFLQILRNHRGARISSALTNRFKEEYGGEGRTADIHKMLKSDLDNILILFKENSNNREKISIPLVAILYIYTMLKHIRRMIKDEGKFNREMMKICMVTSSGGHLTLLLKLKEWWKNESLFWVTFKKQDVISSLKDQKCYWCSYPTNRNVKALIKNTFLAFYVLFKEKPDIIVSSGAAVAIPFFYIGKLLGKKLVYIEAYERIYTKTLTGRIVYPITDVFIVQWKEQLKLYPKATYLGGVY